jgi:opacity protein-like surface antigen
MTRVTLCVAGAALCAQQASAADWQVAPSAHVGTSYADNPRLLPEGGSSSSGAIGEMKASLKRLTDRSELTLRPRFVSSRYSDDETLDSDDQFVTAGYRWVGERSEWNTQLGLTRDTTLTSELGSTGLVQSNRRHESASFTVAPTVMFTERVSGGVQMFLLDNRYVDADSTGLVDYRYTALSLFSTVLLSDAGSALTVTAQGGELSTGGFFGSATRDGSLRLGWSFQPWLLWTATLSAGPSMVETDAGRDSGFVFDSEIKRQGDRWSLTANAGRSQSPTGRGVLTRRDEFKLSFNRSITERLSANVAARWVRSEDLLQQQAGAVTYQVDYSRLDIGANWRLSRDWSLSLQLSGNTQNYELATERANGYRASLNIVWNGQPQSL